MRIEPELGGCTIVLLGHFNPAIFSPAWFGKTGLISETTEKEAVVNVIHNEIASLKLGKIKMQIELHRFSADVMEAPWIDLSDFVVRTFGEFLTHTPVHQFGINRLVHFSAGSEEQRNAIGYTLAPLEPWGVWGEEIKKADASLRGGLNNLVMLQKKAPKDGVSGFIQAQIQPSTRLSGNSGIYMHVNDHYEVGRPGEVEGCSKAIEIINKEFEASLKRSEAIIDQVMALKETQ